MRTLEVIVRDELRHEHPKMSLPERHDVVQQLGLDREHEALGAAAHPRCA
jgi:hypothetical protein